MKCEICGSKTDSVCGCNQCGLMYCDECNTIHDSCCIECLEKYGPPEEELD
jgi:hypothetical protein